ncbi:DUF3089 domain-containing protein [Nocardia stercoris]|uniref:DUF3089 domain-containing protein n=1 Tax=Nocardia stercoris TaxID=2483361 RepID=A0A3M2KW77_9NOCA|nr:DUF3089 domain-containing protein [Nocardia stercoris]RMI28710.1 DUF3089 domain-containing protein [Nocardia stercoris]
MVWSALAAAALTLLGAPLAVAQPSVGTTWLCRPGMVDNPCELPSGTTDLLTGAVTPDRPATDADRPVDCFYVYPTVSNQISLHGDPVAAPEYRSIAEFQAARFSSMCRVFAPVYREVPLAGLGPGLLGAGSLFDTGYADVLAAWNDYLAHDNDGRGVVFIGHSQGTMMLRKLIREQVDPDPALRDRVVGAFLMGGNVTTARDSTTGGDFADLPLCTQPGQDGCVVAYSTEIAPIPSIFGDSELDLLSGAMGLPHGPGYQVACTDPAVLAGDDSPVGLTIPSAPFAPGGINLLLAYTAFPDALPTSPSAWTTSRGQGTGRCVDPDGFHRYHIDLTVPEAINELPLANTHLADINWGLDRLVDIAQRQTRTWLAAH